MAPSALTKFVVPANAGTPAMSAIALIATARSRVSALGQTPSAKGNARGYGSRRSPGRPAESLCEAATLPQGGGESREASPCPA